jgi:succinate-semialdehyde dehydrogenase / glutarate-semialdehyde dehydrogenase
MTDVQMLIGEESVGAKDSITVRNPATGEIIGSAPQGTAHHAERAMDAAWHAFRGWASTAPSKRGEILHRAADVVRSRKDELSRLLTMEQGKPLGEALSEVNASAEALKYFGEAPRRLLGESIPTDSPSRRSVVIRQPLGPVAAIGPWNYPVLLLSWKVGPALAAGCTVVAKPSSDTPLAATKFLTCLAEAGLPAGVLNVVTGPGGEVGGALVTSPHCRKVALTGQTDTGKEVMRLAAGRIVRLTLELGGHCPLIVCPDADLGAAVWGGVYRSFRNMGQVCNAINRIYVHEAVYEQFVEQFVERTAALRIGNGLDPDVDLGPMTKEEGRETARRQIRDAVSKGARILYGGREPEGARYERGFFFLPTVLADVTHEMEVMRQETFGPLAPIMSVKSIEEAIARANDSCYGLGAYVYTQDLKTAFEVAERLEVGTVGVNNVAGGEVPFPYGGWKQSGFGIENSHHAVEEYTGIKHIRFDVGR